MSAIQDFIFKLNMMETRAKFLKNHKVLVGWANDAYEKPRTKNKRVNNLGHKKNERITIDVDGKEFIGPMNKGAPLAVIAKTLCYGRAAGETENGHKYNAIPARNFVQVLRNRHQKPLLSEMKNQLLNGVDLDRLGVMCVGQLRRSINDSNEYLPNAPATKKAKGSERPLIDTGTLRRSVDFEIK